MCNLLYNNIVMKQFGYVSGQPSLDAIFSALSDPTRRAILCRLAESEASVNELAEPFSMSQPAISRHLKVLERAGLVERGVEQQRRPARLKAEPMAAAVDWLDTFRRFWETSFDQLDEVLNTLKLAQKGESDNE